MDIEFKSVKDLYKRLKPALEAKTNELKRKDLDYIREEDIWNYLKSTKWESAKDLLLYEMVDDILKLNDKEIDEYVKNRIRSNIIKPNLRKMKWDDEDGKEEK